MTLAKLPLLLVVCVYATPLSAAELGKKHILLLRTGLDSIWGEYIFSVQNEKQTAIKAAVPLLLPQETVDFRANEGALDAELQLDNNGKVVLHKEFATGASIVSVLFRSNAEQGNGILTFVSERELTSLALMYEKSMQLEADTGLFSSKQSKEIEHDNFTMIQTQAPIKAGKTIVLRVSGIPQGRSMLHLYASIFAAILIVGAVVGVSKTT